jgi:hypothetical protein
MLKIALGLVVAAHGVGHMLFLLPSLRLADWAGQTGHSWLLTDVVGDTLTRTIAAVIWGGATVLFLAGAFGLAAGLGWWRGAMIAAAIVSLVGIVLMWDGIAASSAFFALAFDVAILVGLVWADWPSAELAGS